MFHPFILNCNVAGYKSQLDGDVSVSANTEEFN
jgi:hypothetical protein